MDIDKLQKTIDEAEQLIVVLEANWQRNHLAETDKPAEEGSYPSDAEYTAAKCAFVVRSLLDHIKDPE